MAFMSSLTYAVLKTRVARALGGQGDANMLLVAGDAINEAISYLNGRKDWNWSIVTSSTVTALVGGTADYTLDADYKKAYDVRIDQGGWRTVYPIDFRHYDRVRYNQELTMAPDFYTVHVTAAGAPTIRLHPTPDANGTIIVKYFRKISSLTLDAATLDMPQIHDHMLLALAKSYLCADRDAESPRTGFWMQRFEEEFRRLAADDDQLPDRDPVFLASSAWMTNRYDPTHPYFYLDER
jgi:hypothetical protein